MGAGMNALLRAAGPSAADLIRADHTRVMATFHRYGIDSSPRTKRKLAEAICLALEVHAQMEEEVLYPALREAGSELVEKSFPEHEEVRRLIAALRRLDPADEQFDATFMDLMRAVMHHVADEETVLLPQAESLLAERLGELGGRMAKIRLQQKAGKMPKTTVLIGAGALLTAFLALRQIGVRAR
jgi:hemerythrin superfamily protein